MPDRRRQDRRTTVAAGYGAAILAHGVDPARAADPDLRRLVDRIAARDLAIAALQAALERETRLRRATEEAFMSA